MKTYNNALSSFYMFQESILLNIRWNFNCNIINKFVFGRIRNVFCTSHKNSNRTLRIKYSRIFFNLSLNDILKNNTY